MINKILVAVDGSEHADKAVQFAAETAKHHGAELHIIHVISTPVKMPEDLKKYMESEGLQDAAYYKAYRHVGEEVLSRARNDAASAGVENVECHLEEGDAAQEIVNFANRGSFEMIVLGSRGLGKIKGLVLGSVSTKVCHTADQTCVTMK